MLCMSHQGGPQISFSKKGTEWYRPEDSPSHDHNLQRHVQALAAQQCLDSCLSNEDSSVAW